MRIGFTTPCSIVLAFLLLISAVTHAASTAQTKISMLRGFNATASKGAYIEVVGTLPNPAGCANAQWARAAESEIADFDQQFSMLLAAHIAGRNVIVQVHDTECSHNYPKFINVYVY